MSWTTPSAHIFATSEVVTASTLNTYVQANLTFLGIGYGASMYQAGAAAGLSTLSIVPLDSIYNDPNGMCTTGVGAKITIPANAGGIYLVTARLAATSVIDLKAAISQSAATAFYGTELTAGATHNPGSTVAKQIKCSAADYIQLMVGFASATFTSETGVGSVYLDVHLIGPN